MIIIYARNEKKTLTRSTAQRGSADYIFVYIYIYYGLLFYREYIYISMSAFACIFMHCINIRISLYYLVVLMYMCLCLRAPL